jgi:hypothetical protein
MKEYIIIDDLDFVDTAESTYGNWIYSKNKLIIPFYNIQIGEDNSLGDENYYYIKYAYLVFDEISIITWNYEYSRMIEAERRECYGGVHNYDDSYAEFWIEYNKGYLYLDPDYKSSKQSYSSLDSTDDSFFSSANKIAELL